MKAKNAAAKALLMVLPACGLAGAVAAVQSGPPLAANSARQPPGQPAAPLPPGKFYLGAREKGVPGPWEKMLRFGQMADSHPDLALYYSDWKEPFRLGFAQTAARYRATVLVQMQSWETPLRAIAAGRYDRYLNSYAASVRRFRHPVVIGFDHEMNGAWYPWGHSHQPASDFVAAWQHIVTVFRKARAANVTWLWTISHDSKGTGPLPRYWPGDGYVDWVGLDGYYYHRQDSFYTVFGKKIRQIRKTTRKPILLSEVGIGPIAGQARKIPGLFAGIKLWHLLGLVWFDVAQREPPYHQDWRLEGHPRAVAAFRQGLSSLP